MVLQRRRGGNLGLYMLGAQLMNFGLQNVPPVTLALLVGQVAIFLDMFPKFFPSATGVCMSTYLVLHHRDWRRMILATFYHADDMHLYFNMISLLYKGVMLERKFGSPYFAYMVTVFTALTSATYVGLGLMLGNLIENDSYLTSCAVGFSGVLFALKVLATEYSPAGTQYLFGVIPVPSKYIFWAELVAIQLITPNASFIGHLAGILVGVAYTRGPLRLLMDAFFPSDLRVPSDRGSSSGFQEFQFPFSGSSRSQTRFYRGQGRAARNDPYNGNRGRTPSAPPYDGPPYNDQPYGGYYPQPQPGHFDAYTGGLDEDEQLRRVMEESRREHQGQSNQRLYPDLDDLRTRRAAHFQ